VAGLELYDARSAAGVSRGFALQHGRCAHNGTMSLGQPAQPERWALQAGDAATATLLIPADARRQRQFEIACVAIVDVPTGAAAPWMQLTVQANGSQQWHRQAPAHNPGAWDSLDYRFRRHVPVGQTLRVTVVVAGQGVRRRRLDIEAEEA
jgi:hypothetical protein